MQIIAPDSFILKTQVFKINILKICMYFSHCHSNVWDNSFWCSENIAHWDKSTTICDWLCKWPRIANVPLMQEIKNKDSHETSTWTVTNILAHIESDLIIDLEWQSQQTQSYRTLYNQLMLTTFLCTDTLWYLVLSISSGSKLWHKQRRQELADSVA